MASGPRRALEDARRIAIAVSEVLAPACARIEIAGSIRREQLSVTDIELVAEPRLLTDLFGEPAEGPTDLDLLVDRLIAQQLLAPREPRRMGQRFKALAAVRTNMPIDLFIVRPPRTWGATLAIRTGSAEFSRFMVAEARRRGRRVDECQVWDEDGERIPTPTERDFFAACRVAWVPPRSRS